MGDRTNKRAGSAETGLLLVVIGLSLMIQYVQHGFGIHLSSVDDQTWFFSWLLPIRLAMMERMQGAILPENIQPPVSVLWLMVIGCLAMLCAYYMQITRGHVEEEEAPAKATCLACLCVLSSSTSNAGMVKNLMDNGIITSPFVQRTLLLVDRMLYVGELCAMKPQRVYHDGPVYLGYNVQMSAPHIHATALQLMADRVELWQKTLRQKTGVVDSSCRQQYEQAVKIEKRGKKREEERIPIAEKIRRNGLRCLDIGSGTGYMTSAMSVLASLALQTSCCGSGDDSTDMFPKDEVQDGATETLPTASLFEKEENAATKEEGGGFSAPSCRSVHVWGVEHIEELVISAREAVLRDPHCLLVEQEQGEKNKKHQNPMNAHPMKGDLPLVTLLHGDGLSLTCREKLPEKRIRSDGSRKKNKKNEGTKTSHVNCEQQIASETTTSSSSSSVAAAAAASASNSDQLPPFPFRFHIVHCGAAMETLAGAQALATSLLAPGGRMIVPVGPYPKLLPPPSPSPPLPRNSKVGLKLSSSSSRSSKELKVCQYLYVFDRVDDYNYAQDKEEEEMDFAVTKHRAVYYVPLIHEKEQMGV